MGVTQRSSDDGRRERYLISGDSSFKGFRGEGGGGTICLGVLKNKERVQSCPRPLAQRCWRANSYNFVKGCCGELA